MSNIPRTALGEVDVRAFDDPAGVTIYAHGLCYASVCSALPVEQVDAAMAAWPSGVASPWQRVTDRAFADGTPNPCPCDAVPDRTHYLYAC